MKSLLTLPLLLLLCTTACGPTSEGVRKELIKQCREQGAKSGVAGEMKTIYENFCDCTAEQITEQMSGSDYKAMEKLKKDGKTAEAQAMLQPVIQSCIEDWQRQTEAAATAQPHDSTLR